MPGNVPENARMVAGMARYDYIKPSHDGYTCMRCMKRPNTCKKEESTVHEIEKGCERGTNQEPREICNRNSEGGTDKMVGLCAEDTRRSNTKKSVRSTSRRKEPH